MRAAMSFRRPGLVGGSNAEQVIRHLKHFQAYEINSARLLGAWMPGIRRWETKHDIGPHLWQDAEASRDLRTRLWELRVANPDRDLAPGLAATVKGFASAQEDFEFLAGLYGYSRPNSFRPTRTSSAAPRRCTTLPLSP